MSTKNARKPVEQPPLKRFIRDDKGNPIGVVVGTRNGVGWSICGNRDEYDPYIGLKIAVNRANYTKGALTLPSHINESKELADRLEFEVNAMCDRHAKYFKEDAELAEA